METKTRTQAQKSTARLIGVAVVIVLAGLAGLMAIRAHGPLPGASGPSPVANRSTAASPEGLPPAPDVDVVMYQGETAVGGSRVRLSQLWGKGKPLVLNFFAGLCPPCRGELPDFQRLYTQRGNSKFTLIGVDIGPFVGLGSRDDGRVLLRELKITFPAGTAMVAAPIRAYGILGMPTTVFITPDGKIFRRYTGMLTRGQMETFTDELLKASGIP